MTATIEPTTAVSIPREVATAGISDRAFRLYVLLRTDSTGPLGSQREIAAKFSLSLAYVSRAMRELAEHGLLSARGSAVKYDFPTASLTDL